MKNIAGLMLCSLLLGACSQKEELLPPAPKPVLVGVVDQVYQKHKYVLVRLSGSMPKEGTVLISQSPVSSEKKRVANLMVTSERIGKLRVPADIRSGTAESGDLVFLYRNLTAPESTSPEAEQTPKEGELPTVETPSIISLPDESAPQPNNAPALPPLEPLSDPTPESGVYHEDLPIP